MRTRQQELFGRELPENELLAIAQHYGFPTPLLDFSRSLRVAAFSVARLEELANIEENKLWQVVAELAPENWVAPSDGPPLSRTPANHRQRIALSCALYLVAWSHLCTVNGWRARTFSNIAREVLASYGDTGPVGIES